MFQKTLFANIALAREVNLLNMFLLKIEWNGHIFTENLFFPTCHPHQGLGNQQINEWILEMAWNAQICIKNFFFANSTYQGHGMSIP